MKKSELNKLIKEELKLILTEEENPNTKDINLSDDEMKELSKVISILGGDLEDVINTDINEAPKEYAAMSIEELEDGGYVLKIDNDLLDNIDDFVQEGLHAKDWYNDMSKSMKSALGDSDGCLFLMIFAAFSPRNAIKKNFRQATKFYHGVKHDVENNPDLLHAILNSDVNGNELNKRIKQKDESVLKLKSISNIAGTGALPTYYPNLGRLLDFYKSRNYKFTTDDVYSELSRTFDTKTGGLRKDKILGAEKVLSFALNFIKPEGTIGENWFPVTIDTWVASLFYPQLSSDEKSKMLGKRQNYVYLSKHIQKIAKRYNMVPQEMQAVLWVGKMLKTSPNLVTIMDDVFDNLTEQFNIQIEHMKKTDEYFKQLISEVSKS